MCVSDPAGSEVQQRCGLVVVRSAAVRDADRSVSVPRPRWRGAVPVHTNRQPCLSSLAHQRRQRHSDQGRTWFHTFFFFFLNLQIDCLCVYYQTHLNQSCSVCNLWCVSAAVCEGAWGASGSEGEHQAAQLLQQHRLERLGTTTGGAALQTNFSKYTTSPYTSSLCRGNRGELSWLDWTLGVHPMKKISCEYVYLNVSPSSLTVVAQWLQ